LEVDELLRRLDAHYSVEGWWPAESPWEIMVGAIMVQQTNWESVAGVLEVLRGRDLLEVDAMDAMPLADLEAMIRPTGFYRQKSRNLRALASFLKKEHRSDPMDLLCQDTEAARRELLSLPGIGNETADVILLFAGGRPCFIAAGYVSRILGRTGILRSENYHEVRRFMEACLEPDPERYAHYYALLVQHARTTCRSRPRCDACVLSAECELNRGKGTAGSPPRRRTPAKR
jgi:endonuclease-3 related protein